MSAVIVAIATTAVSVGSQVYGGVQAKKAGKKSAKLQRQQTDETLRLKENEIQSFQGEQTVAFAKAGVLLDGTPLDVLEATRREGNRQKSAIERTGVAQANLYETQGKTALIQGITGGIASAGQGAVGVSNLNARNKGQF